MHILGAVPWTQLFGLPEFLVASLRVSSKVYVAGVTDWLAGHVVVPPSGELEYDESSVLD